MGVFHLEVDNPTLTCCRGLLGIETLSKNGGNPDVFLYVTEASSNNEIDDEEQEIRNRVYRYQWNGQSLVNPEMILDLPAEPGPNHPGGKLKFGLDGYLLSILTMTECFRTLEMVHLQMRALLFSKLMQLMALEP